MMSDVSNWLRSLGEIMDSLHDSIDLRHVHHLIYLTLCQCAFVIGNILLVFNLNTVLSLDDLLRRSLTLVKIATANIGDRFGA